MSAVGEIGIRVPLRRCTKHPQRPRSLCLSLTLLLLCHPVQAYFETIIKKLKDLGASSKQS